MKALITQSNYIPWKGYFENIAQADVFVVYDDMQFTKRDWRNRNKIKTAQGSKWLTVPVEVKGKFDQAINATRVSDGDWRRNHVEQIRHAYGKAAHFKDEFPWISGLYETADQENITELNVHFLKAICDRLGINTEFRDSREFVLATDRTERLVSICEQLGATEYLTGPAAKNYMDGSSFAERGINVVYADYEGYPEYPQVHPPFEHGVSIWDVFLNCGDAAREMVLKGNGSVG